MSANTLSFKERCYQILSKVPEGKVTTYGEIAFALNCRAYRAVGRAMAGNEKLVVIPCHRVVRSDGSIGQYALGSERKAELLESEGVLVKDRKIENFTAYLHRFST
jgi:methylated-DNA-[protein]-cysteine S-methyltransferase